MPEINNALAAQIQVPQTDALGTFGKISQFQKLQADTALVQKETALRQSELRGRAANEIYQDPTDEGLNRAFQHFEQNGTPLDNLTKQRMLAMSPDQRKATAAQIVAGSMPPSTYTEQSGNPAYRRSYGARAGEIEAQINPPGSNIPQGAGSNTSAPPQRISGTTGAEAGENTAPVPRAQALKTIEVTAAQGPERLKKYEEEGTNASLQSAALHQMQVDASQVRMGSGSTKEEMARKVITAIGDTLPSLRPYTESISNKSAAFQSFEKNAGIVSRAITKEVGTTAASGLDMVTQALLSNQNTNKGVDINASQLIGMTHFKQARSFAATPWSEEHGGDMSKFESNFNKNASVSAWMFKALPPDQQKIVADYLDKAPGGKEYKSVLTKQLDYIRKKKLDEGVY